MKKLQESTKRFFIRNHNHRSVLFIAISIVIILVTLAGCAQQRDIPEIIEVPASAKRYTEMDYKEVESELKDAGFTNITFKKVPDLVLGLIHQDGEVISVSINGDADFKAADTFSETAIVIITYHTYPERSKSHSDRVN